MVIPVFKSSDLWQGFVFRKDQSLKSDIFSASKSLSLFFSFSFFCHTVVFVSWVNVRPEVCVFVRFLWALEYKERLLEEGR